VATETIYGTAIAAPSTYLPALSYDTFDDEQGVVLDDAPRGVPAKVQAIYPGVRQGKWGATFPYYPNQIGRFFPRLFGTDTIGSSSNGAWQHTFLANSSASPLSDTIFVFTGSTAFESRFAGSVYTNLDFKFSRATGMVTAKVAAIGFAPTTSIGEQSPSYTADPAFRGYNCVFALGGTTQNTLLDFEANFTREQELVFAANNSQNPAAFESGALDIKGKMKFYGSTEKPYTDYRANVQQSMDLVFQDSTTMSMGASTSNRLEMLFSKIEYTKVTPVMSGKYLAWEIDFQCIHNSSAGGDSGPASIFTTVATSSAF
jgi:hypothetical protein